LVYIQQRRLEINFERTIAIIILKTCTPPKREVAFTICLYEFGFSAVLIYLDKLIFVKIY